MKHSRANEMTFFEHLGELRKRLLFSVLYILVFFLLAWSVVDRIYLWLARPILRFLPAGQKLVFTSLAEPFMMYIKVSFIAGLFAASPFIFHQLWLFIAPALFPKERRLVLPFVFFTTLFFLAGGAFGYTLVFPAACRFFLGLGQGFTPMITIQEYFSLAFQVLFGIAIIFELPVLIFLLARFGLVTSRFLLRHFKYALVGIFVVAAVITPTPDVVTQSLFALPMLFLYVLGIGIAALVERRKPREPDAD